MSIYRKDRLTKLFQTKEWTDCTFMIDKERIAAHKFLLACTSPVFESMFYGDLASDEIIIEDIDSDVFKKALEYIYTDSINIDTVLEAWSLVYVSQKYFLFELQRLCVDYIKENLSINSLLMSYEYSKLYNQKVLLEKCLDDIFMYTRGILLFSDYHMQSNTLQGILKDNRGNTTDLVMLAISWGMEECALQDLVPSKENMYSVFKKSGLSNELRFKDLNLYYSKSMLKTATKEQLYAFENIINLCEQFYRDYNYSPSLFNNIKENKEMQFQFRTEYKNSVSLRITHNELLSPIVICNRDCLIFGIVVATKSRPLFARGDEYRGGANVYIYVKHSKNISHLIFEHEQQHAFLEYNGMQKIIFPAPVLFKAFKQYMICIEYVADCVGGECVLLRYMSDKLYKHKNSSTVIQFMDEGNGSVLKGLCYYEA